MSNMWCCWCGCVWWFFVRFGFLCFLCGCFCRWSGGGGGDVIVGGGGGGGGGVCGVWCVVCGVWFVVWCVCVC